MGMEMAKASDQPSGHGVTADVNEDNVHHEHGGQEKKQWREQEIQNDKYDNGVDAGDTFEQLRGHHPRSLFERISRPKISTPEQPSAKPDQRTQVSNPHHSPTRFQGSRYIPRLCCIGPDYYTPGTRPDRR